MFLSQLKHLLEFHLCYVCSVDLARVLKGDQWSVKLTLITLDFFKLNELYFAQIICVSKTLLSLCLKRNKQWDEPSTFPLTFYFKLVIDSQDVAKNNTEIPCCLHSATQSPIVTSYPTLAHYQNQEINLGIIQFTRLQILLKVHQFLQVVILYVCSSF